MRNKVQAAITAERITVSLERFLLIDPVKSRHQLLHHNYEYVCIECLELANGALKLDLAWSNTGLGRIGSRICGLYHVPTGLFGILVIFQLCYWFVE